MDLLKEEKKNLIYLKHNMQNFVILGIVASVVLEIIKQATGGMESWKSKASILAVSILTGVGYVYLTRNPDYMQVVLSVLGAASVAYNFIIKDAVTGMKERFSQEG